MKCTLCTHDPVDLVTLNPGESIWSCPKCKAVWDATLESIILDAFEGARFMYDELKDLLRRFQARGGNFSHSFRVETVRGTPVPTTRYKTFNLVTSSHSGAGELPTNNTGVNVKDLDTEDSGGRSGDSNDSSTIRRSDNCSPMAIDLARGEGRTLDGEEFGPDRPGGL